MHSEEYERKYVEVIKKLNWSEVTTLFVATIKSYGKSEPETLEMINKLVAEMIDTRNILN